MEKKQIFAYTLRGTEDEMKTVLETCLREVGENLSFLGDDLLETVKNSTNPYDLLLHIHNLRLELTAADLHLEDAESIYKEMVKRQMGDIPIVEEEIESVPKTDKDK